MAEDDAELPEPPPAEVPAPRRTRRWRRVLAGLAIAGLVALFGAWLSRERIADDFIAGQIASSGVPVTYRVESIGARHQVLSNIVVGDPARPDLTIARVEVDLALGWSGPVLGRIVLDRPRLHGTLRGGRVSFGSLDPLIYTDSKEPFRLPDLDLAIRDGRALIEGPFGAAGLKLAGEGPLRGGFAGVIAATAPDLLLGDCRARSATLYGKLSVSRERPRFAGPLRLRGLACEGRGAALASADAGIDLTLAPALDGAEGKAALSARGMAAGEARIASAKGDLRLAWRKGTLTAHYDLSATGLAAPAARAGEVALSGSLRGGDGFARIESEGELSARAIAPGAGAVAALADLQAAAAGTPAAPMAAQVRAALLRESRGSSLKAGFIVRRTGRAVNLVSPQAILRGGSGAALLSLSRLQVLSVGQGGPRISGNFATGGPGLPRIAGRMERAGLGQMLMRLEMPEYRAGDARLAVPELMLAQAGDGSLGFAGKAVLSGALPGGHAQNLSLPLEGNWSARNGLALWRRCVTLGFDRLAIASLSLERRAVQLCPRARDAILRIDSRGFRLAAGSPSVDLKGRLGQSPVRITGGAVGLAWPGALSARNLAVTLGPTASPSRFVLSNLTARLGGNVAGTFDGADVSLASVPLDLLDAAGTWRFAQGRLTIEEAGFRLEDRAQVDRFAPLMARGARLSLFDNVIAAEAGLAEPSSGREVLRAVIGHDLSGGRGHADLLVDDLRFDERLQPDMLSHLVLGVVANARGSVKGRGRIDWTPERVTSSGTFGTDGLDFAAAFGPVKGAEGTIVFTDLLGLVTAPGQELRVASINPGIEVNDGRIGFEMRPGSVLAITGGRWPFLGGVLRLEPTVLNFGVAEERRYTLGIDGLDSAKLAQKMELGNIAVSGVFDGFVPLVFDKDGGRIEGGTLLARPPGGNLSYVGALSYKDMGTMANFAFDALKSMDYRQMRIALDGSLEGEILTRVTFDGIKQGQGARRNFLTRRIARLPIRFNVNLRAPFFQLATSLRSMYDAHFLRDPASLGLTPPPGQAWPPQPSSKAGDKAPAPAIQPPASGSMP